MPACWAASPSARGARVGSGAVVTKAVPAGATAVGNPARIIEAKADAEREAAAAKMGFSAYGITQGDDPVALAMKGLIDNASGHEHQIALLWQAIEKSRRSRASCRPRSLRARRTRTTGVVRRRAAEPARQVAGRGSRQRGGRCADLGRNALHSASSVFEVGAADQVDAVRHRREDARHRRLRRGQPAASRRSTSAGPAG